MTIKQKFFYERIPFICFLVSIYSWFFPICDIGSFLPNPGCIILILILRFMVPLFGIIFLVVYKNKQKEIK